ncbi:MAG: branched-chain amino acid ABC transporter permease [Albidovulum sp.]|nr:branched-chain amino acid ABC transporter permease [Albidovulum sp.]
MLVDFLVVGISIGLVYAIVALGISLIYSGLDIVHFAHGEFVMFGAFFGLVLVNDSGLNYPISIFLAMIFAGLMGVVVERVFYRRLTSKGGGYTVAGMGMIICGFGMAIILQNIAFLIWGAEGHAINVDFGTPMKIGTVNLPKSYLWILCVSVGLMAILHLFLKNTKAGLAIRAVAANKDIAYLMGINVPLMISLIFGLACGLAAVGGVLIGPINYVQVEMGYLILIKGFAAAVVGGFGSLPGAILGGLMVGIFETLGAGYISGSHKDIYAFLLLIAVLVIRPTGLFGQLAKSKA